MKTARLGAAAALSAQPGERLNFHSLLYFTAALMRVVWNNRLPIEWRHLHPHSFK